MKCRFWRSCRPCPSPRPLHDGSMSMGEDTRGGKPPLTWPTLITLESQRDEPVERFNKIEKKEESTATVHLGKLVSSMCYSETRASAHACMDPAHLDPICGPPPSGLRLPHGSPSLLTWSKQGLNLILRSPQHS